jgi:N-formylglutamate amidohydrolase
MRDGPAFSVHGGRGSIVATAIHAGHELRPEVSALTNVDDATRRREEDPFTDRLTRVTATRLVAYRSRFEVDLNRPRDRAVYREPDDAWGLDLWREPLGPDIVERSLDIYDAFYASLADVLDRFDARGPFVVLDLHSYNHRRGGPDAPPGPEDANPEVNVGTGSLDRHRWGGLVDRFIKNLRRAGVSGRELDVRENVRFDGGHLSQWVHERYAARGCALAIELKKTYMDEWTGEVDDRHLDELKAALRATLPDLLQATDGTRR